MYSVMLLCLAKLHILVHSNIGFGYAWGVSRVKNVLS